MRTSISVLLLSAVVLAAMACPAVAERNILTPTGDTLEMARFKLEGAIDVDDGDNRLFWAALGLGRYEVEFHHSDSANASQNTFNLQMSLLPQTTVTPGVAVGVLDVTDEVDRTVYGAVSKVVPFSDVLPLPVRDIRLTAGLGIGGLSGLFLGAEATVSRLRVQLEYDTDDFNVALGLPFVDTVTAKALWIKDDFYVGVEVRPRF